MKKMTEGEVRFEADRLYVRWVGGYGLKDAQRIWKGLGKKFKDEVRRRKELNEEFEVIRALENE